MFFRCSSILSYESTAGFAGAVPCNSCSDSAHPGRASYPIRASAISGDMPVSSHEQTMRATHAYESGQREQTVLRVPRGCDL